MSRRLIAVIGAALIVAAACQAQATPTPTAGPTPTPTAAPTPTTPPTPTPEPTPVDYEAVLFNYQYTPVTGQAGGEVVIGEWQPPDNLSPYYANAFATFEVLAATHGGLWTVTSDGHYKPYFAAKMPKFSDNSIRQAADGSFEVDLEMLPGLQWSDGTPLTLNDLKYTWEWNMDPAQVGLVAGTTGWEDITAFDVSADGLTATVKFGVPYAGFYGLLGAPILPKHYFETIPVVEASEKSMPVSAAIANVPASGPFKFETASPEAITLVRNDKFTGGAFGQGAYLDRVKYQFYADVDGMKAAFLAGDLDVALNMVAADYDSIKGVDPSIGKALLEPAWQYEHLDMNTGTGHVMLRDVAVRTAIAEAIDKSDLFAALFPGYPIPEQAACTNAPPGTYWRNPDVTCPEFNVEQAKADLAAAGWTDSNADGTVDKDGVEAVLEACTSAGRPVRELTLQKIKGYMEEIGIQVNVNLVDSTSILFAGWTDTTAETKCSIYRGTFDFALYAYVLTFDVFGDYGYSYSTDQIPDNPPHDGGNVVRLSNPEMDAAVEVLKTAIKPADIVAAAFVIQRIYTEQSPEIALYYRSEARGVSIRLQNFFKNPGTASDMWNIEDWFVQE